MENLHRSYEEFVNFYHARYGIAFPVPSLQQWLILQQQHTGLMQQILQQQEIPTYDCPILEEAVSEGISDTLSEYSCSSIEDHSKARTNKKAKTRDRWNDEQARVLVLMWKENKKRD